jgi:hypothetical protein
LPNKKLEQRVIEVFEKLKKAGKVKEADINIIKMQAHFLSAVNDENRNILHLGCYRGNLDLIEFINEKAGKEYLDILKFIVNVKDDMGRPPIYVLCVGGF